MEGEDVVKKRLALMEDNSIYWKPNQRIVAKSANPTFVKAKFNYESACGGNNLALLKLKNMKPQATNQELLLFACTGFFSRSFSTINQYNEQPAFCFNMENLEKACWAGILNDILPELIAPASPDQKNYLWHTTPGGQFLKVNMGPHPRPVENETSIDPYFFLSTINSN